MPHPRTERLPRIAPERMNEEQKAVAAAIPAGPRGEVRGPFIALLRSPGLAGPIFAYLSVIASGLRGFAVERRAGEIVQGLAAAEQELGRLGEELGVLGKHLFNATQRFSEVERTCRGSRRSCSGPLTPARKPCPSDECRSILPSPRAKGHEVVVRRWFERITVTPGREAAVAGALAFALFFAGTADVPLLGRDEARFAQAARDDARSR